MRNSCVVLPYFFIGSTEVPSVREVPSLCRNLQASREAEMLPASQSLSRQCCQTCWQGEEVLENNDNIQIHTGGQVP